MQSLVCPWCKKENDFTFGDSKGNPGWLYDLDQKENNTWQCNGCGHINQVVVGIEVFKFEPINRNPAPKLKEEADVLFAEEAKGMGPKL